MNFDRAARLRREPRLAELGRQMVAGAVRLRLDALRASGRLLVAASFPDLPQYCPRIRRFERCVRLPVYCCAAARLTALENDLRSSYPAAALVSPTKRLTPPESRT